MKSCYKAVIYNEKNVTTNYCKQLEKIVQNSHLIKLSHDIVQLLCLSFSRLMSFHQYFSQSDVDCEIASIASNVIHKTCLLDNSLLIFRLAAFVRSIYHNDSKISD